MNDIERFLIDIDTEDAATQKAKETLNKMSLNPSYRNEIIAKAEKRMQELQDQDWAKAEETFEITLKKENLLQLKITLVFYSEILGIPPEDVLPYLLLPGLQQEAYKLGLVRQAVMSNMGMDSKIPPLQNLSIQADQFVDDTDPE